MLSLRHGFFFATSAVFSVLASTSCPVYYSNMFGDNCYKIVQAEMTWDDARMLCQRDDGDLVSIHSQAENDAIQAALPGCCGYWIGLRCNSNSEVFWSDGTSVDYNNNKDTVRCDPDQAVFLSQTNGLWFFDKPSDPTGYVICEFRKTLHVSTTTTIGPLPGGGSECGLGYQLLDDNSGICVRITDELTTWREAEAECQLEGAHLASIHSKQTNDYIRRVALSQRLVNAIFIGIKMDSQTNAVSWSDASDIDFTNFDLGMPNAFFGECGAMQTGNLGGEWTSVFCDDSNKLPFACSKPQPCPATNTFTGSGDFTSPEYPSSRSSGLSCEYFIGATSGSLVLLRFDEFQLVDGDQVILYEGMGTSAPLAVITNAAPTDRFMTKTLSVMRVVHLSGSGSGIRKWHANFFLLFILFVVCIAILSKIAYE